MKNLESASKFLSLLLRHKPEALGLKIDKEGWVSIQELINKSEGQKISFTSEIINEIVNSDSKQRYAISKDGLSIRANQGHSISVDLDLKPEVPPVLLFHGTAEMSVPEIMKKGLLKMNRQHVHLSSDFSTAVQVGSRRKGQSVILVINAKVMFQKGFKFFKSDNGVWLIEHVPPEFIAKLNGYSDFLVGN